VPFATLLIALFAITPLASAQDSVRPILLSDDGAWCWFQDERALVYGRKLFVGAVANGTSDKSRRGDIDLLVCDIDSRRVTRYELHDQLEADDHAAPALLRLADGRLLATYSKHGSENCFYGRLTRSAGGTDWLPEFKVIPSEQSRITYSNLYLLSAENEGRGRLYNFFRGLDASFKPSFAFSDDSGTMWQRGSVAIDVPLAFRHRPYVKYASNCRDTIHLLYTDGHPRDSDNSVYHIFYREGKLHRSDGAALSPLARGLKSPDEGTRVFRGDAQNVAWVSDLHLSVAGRSFAVFTVQKDSGGLRSGDEKAGRDHRYHYAWWDGTTWHDHEIARGGSRLYAGEDDYTGNICLDPDRLDTVYFSTNVDPATGQSLVSSADGRRHYELFRGHTANGGQTWKFQPITHDSAVDNLRPIVPPRDDGLTALVWFRGTYRTFRDYDTQVVALPLDAPD
jgi:hypothetical protein